MRLALLIAVATFSSSMDISSELGVGAKRMSIASRSKPTLQLFNGTPGVDQLIPALTINGVTVSPSFRYKGGDADGTDWDAWGYGDTLALQAGTAPSYNQGSPGMGTSDDSVQLNAGGYYQAASSTTGDVTTGDVVIELVFKYCSAVGNVLAKQITSNGYQVYNDSSTLSVLINDGGGNTLLTGGGLTDGCWYHAIAFINRDEASTNGAQWYTNGVTSGAGVDFSARSGSLTTAENLTGGARSNGTSLGCGSVAYMSLWQRSSWHQSGASGPAEWATIAAERFAKLTGTWPQRAKGTKQPTVAVRPSEAYLDKLEGTERKLYLVGDHWMRTVSRPDANSVTITGYLAESQATNEMLQSEDFSTTWALDDVGDSISTDAVEAPSVEDTADSLVADSTNGSHGVSQDVTLTATTHTMSVYVKAGDKDWLYLSDSTVANADAYFDLDTVAVGTVGAAATAGIEDWGGDWRRCWVTFTGTVAAHTLIIRAADADSDSTITGDGSTTTLTLWGAQVEAAPTPSSYTATVASAVTRVKDQLRYKGDDGNVASTGVGSVAFTLLLPDKNTASSGYVFDLSDGGSGADRLYIYHGSGENLAAGGAASGGSAGGAGGTTDVSNGGAHTSALSYKADQIKLFVDDAQEGVTDVDCGIPDDMDRIDIGQKLTGVDQLDGIISNLRIYDRTDKR